MRRHDETRATGRRQFLREAGSLAAGGALLNATIPMVHAGEDGTIRLALIGCGPRGTGAVRDALSVTDAGPVQLHAMADIHAEKIEGALRGLKDEFSERVDVPEDRKLVGFDAYRRAIDTLRPGDVAMCTTRAYIRPVHVEYAVQKGVNVFMEKPFSPDPGGLKRLLKAGAEAEAKGVKIAAGLQCRHSPARQALIEKIRDGELGEIPLIRANRLAGGGGMGSQKERSNQFLKQLEFGKTHLMWVGSGHMVDNLIHQIDECCWIKDSWPIRAHGLGGRTPMEEDRGQNLDVYAIEYTFADGTKAFCEFRRMQGAEGEFATYLHGTKRAAQFSGAIHAATVHMFHDQRIGKSHIAWTPTPDALSPWVYEWAAFLRSIRQDRPHNELRRAVMSDYASLMGRAACHLNRTITWEEITGSDFQFCDHLDRLDRDSPAFVRADEATGQFPVPRVEGWTEL